MKNQEEFSCTYGRGTKSTVFVYGNWYVVKGSQIVNKTYDELFNGVDVEGLQDVDCFNWNKPINTLKQLIKSVES